MSKVVSAVLSPIASIVGYKSNNKAVNTATAQQIRGNQAAQAALDPYMQSGTKANTMLQDKLSSGQLGGSFTPGDLTQDPGYQFRLAEGSKALDRKASAGGSYYSGAALKAAQQFGQGLADTTYNDAYNRWLQEQLATYNMLSGQQSQGRDAATTYGGYATNIGNAQAQGTIQKANNKNDMFGSLFSSLGGAMGGFR